MGGYEHPPVDESHVPGPTWHLPGEAQVFGEYEHIPLPESHVPGPT
jgi:hypothetical protein